MKAAAIIPRNEKSAVTTLFGKIKLIATRADYNYELLIKNVWEFKCINCFLSEMVKKDQWDILVRGMIMFYYEFLRKF